MAEHVYTIDAAHNPEVAGSNPVPATAEGPGNGAFRFSAHRTRSRPRRASAVWALADHTDRAQSPGSE
jgi:hypothetical protein